MTFLKINYDVKVNCVAWAPNSIYVASGGLDCSIIIWSLDLPDKHCIMRNAHDQVIIVLCFQLTPCYSTF